LALAMKGFEKKIKGTTHVGRERSKKRNNNAEVKYENVQDAGIYQKL